MSDKGEIDEGRRGFLKLAGAAPAAAAVAATGAGAQAAAAAPAPAGLRDTPHVRKFFETARF